jgi:hypothetical protein
MIVTRPDRVNQTPPMAWLRDAARQGWLSPDLYKSRMLRVGTAQDQPQTSQERYRQPITRAIASAT